MTVLRLAKMTRPTRARISSERGSFSTSSKKMCFFPLLRSYCWISCQTHTGWGNPALRTSLMNRFNSETFKYSSPMVDTYRLIRSCSIRNCSFWRTRASANFARLFLRPPVGFPGLTRFFLTFAHVFSILPGQLFSFCSPSLSIAKKSSTFCVRSFTVVRNPLICCCGSSRWVSSSAVCGQAGVPIKRSTLPKKMT